MKGLLRAQLDVYDLAAIATLGAQRRRTLTYLVALTYDSEPLIAWRAIEAFGLTAAEASNRDPEFVRGHLRRLLWLLSDESGGIGWHAPELIGEVLHHRPREFAEFAPPLIAVLDLEAEDAPRFRAGSLWGIGRVAETAPQLVRAAESLIEPHLDDEDSQVRGLACLCLGRLGAGSSLSERPHLREDAGRVTLYDRGRFIATFVHDLARQPMAPRSESSGDFSPTSA